jgi:hypothetical protein
MKKIYFMFIILTCFFGCSIQNNAARVTIINKTGYAVIYKAYQLSETCDPAETGKQVYKIMHGISSPLENGSQDEMTFSWGGTTSTLYLRFSAGEYLDKMYDNSDDGVYASWSHDQSTTSYYILSNSDSKTLTLTDSGTTTGAPYNARKPLFNLQ